MNRIPVLMVCFILIFGLSGCGGGTVPKTDDAAKTPDNRPAGFEDMMKGMEGNMTKTAKKK